MTMKNEAWDKKITIPVVEGEVALAQSGAFANPPIPACTFLCTRTQNPSGWDVQQHFQILTNYSPHH